MCLNEDDGIILLLLHHTQQQVIIKHALWIDEIAAHYFAINNGMFNGTAVP